MTTQLQLINIIIIIIIIKTVRSSESRHKIANGIFCVTAPFQTSETAHPVKRHHIPEVLKLHQRRCDNLKSHKRHSPSCLIVHPLFAALHCKVTAKVLAPAEWLRHAVIGTVPACVLHQCQGDAWVNRVLCVSSCHGFILKWNVMIQFTASECNDLLLGCTLTHWQTL